MQKASSRDFPQKKLLGKVYSSGGTNENYPGWKMKNLGVHTK